MGIWAGLMGPKNENVEKVSVFKAFFKAQGSQEDSKKTNDPPAPTVWEGVGGG